MTSNFSCVELDFTFDIDFWKFLTKWFFFLVCLPDSILAFHKNGMQGRSLKNGEITQEISDLSRTYRLLGSDKYVMSHFWNTLDD